MLNCISGMVEKTQSAISILQQRQAEVANLRTAEEMVAEVQAKANMAILEVKEAALEEIKKTKKDQRSEILNARKEEVNIAPLPQFNSNCTF
jgi:crotonobetainyl-CoA:carnitine CoA-transferase CaiB-like acyl-CoA transferase